MVRISITVAAFDAIAAKLPLWSIGEEYDAAVSVDPLEAPIDAAKVAKLKAAGLGPSVIAKRLRIGRASVYRLLKAN
jgi:hypothetical protein